MLEIFQNSVTEKMGTRWSRFLLFCKWGTAGVLHHAILSVLWPPLLLVGDSILCKRQKRFPIRQFKRTLVVLSRFVFRVFLFSWEGGGLLSFRLEKGRRALIRMPVPTSALQCRVDRSWGKAVEYLVYKARVGALKRGGSRVMCNMDRVQGAMCKEKECNVQGARRKSTMCKVQCARCKEEECSAKLGQRWRLGIGRGGRARGWADSQNCIGHNRKHVSSLHKRVCLVFHQISMWLTHKNRTMSEVWEWRT